MASPLWHPPPPRHQDFHLSSWWSGQWPPLQVRPNKGRSPLLLSKKTYTIRHTGIPFYLNESHTYISYVSFHIYIFHIHIYVQCNLLTLARRLKTVLSNHNWDYYFLLGTAWNVCLLTSLSPQHVHLAVFQISNFSG